MKELVEIAFSPVNIGLTIFVIVLILYWILTILSGLDFDLDFDVEVDIDVDADIDIDADTTLDSGNVSIDDFANAELKKETVVGGRRRKLKWWQIILVYFNFVELPFMFTFTFWIFSWWFLTFISTYYTNTYANNIGIILFIAMIIPALFITKIGTSPFKSFFKHLNRKGEESLDLLGRIGVLQNKIQGDKIGTVKVRIDSSPIKVDVKSIDGKLIDADEKIIIIDHKKEENIYLIQSNKTINI
ncbi:hypothetical protein [Aquimarina latercula]|uniref:hypothetical protein n=1 Tax=Aquimarina latercula TaxID=987 RepID=UPI0003F7697D|nr:hypothetical protein [Aquimarina latercula]